MPDTLSMLKAMEEMASDAYFYGDALDREFYEKMDLLRRKLAAEQAIMQQQIPEEPEVPAMPEIPEQPEMPVAPPPAR